VLDSYDWKADCPIISDKLEAWVAAVQQRSDLLELRGQVRKQFLIIILDLVLSLPFPSLTMANKFPFTFSTTDA
jgi:hypothetical protein